jgi:signal transduction histidine kinase/FixJ family two-component response regulator
MVGIVLSKIIFLLFTLVSFATHAKLKLCDQETVINQFLQDKGKLSSIVDCAKETDGPNLGFNKSTKTVFVLDNNIDNKIFYFSFPMIHEVTFYHYIDSKFIETKGYSKINNQGNEYVYFNNLGKINNTILAVIATQNSIQLPYMLFETQEAFNQFLQSRHLFDGLWFGVIFFTFIIAVAFFYIRRKSEIVFYSMHILSLFIIQMAFSGYLFSVLGFLPEYFKHRAVVFACSVLTFGTAGLIFKTFIQQKPNDLLIKSYKVVLYIATTHFIATVFFYNQTIIKFTSYLTLLLSVSSIIVCTYALIKKLKYSFSFLLSFSFFLFSSLAFTLKDLGIMNINEIQANYVVKLSLLIEIFILGGVMVRALFEETKLMTNSSMNQMIAKSNIQIIKKLQHDVQSPLTSLEFFYSEAKSSLTEDLRVIGKQSINRIQDIINSLKINEANATVEENEAIEKMAIYPLLKRIVSEKRNEFKRKLDVTINLETFESKDHFVELKKSYFYRTISNIINNSIEAHRENSNLFINISVKNIDGEIEIMISDNGKGISKENLSAVFEYGKSFDKANGTGIGLFQAKEYIESEGGQISIDSNLNSGTTIIIKLKEAHAPTWYPQDIVINKSNVVIVDDDDSIHNLWREKLSKLGINTIHFKQTLKFENWAENKDLSIYNYFFDLELIGSPHSGLDLIKNYQLQHLSVLVTSHFMDKKVQSKCIKNNIKMLPKESVINLEVKLMAASESQKTLVLIDDDSFTQMSWQKQAKAKGYHIYSFYSVQDFLDSNLSLDKSTPIFIDSELGDGLKGEVLSEAIYKLGYKELYLATGTTPDDIQLPFWIKNVGGKDFGFHLKHLGAYER